MRSLGGRAFVGRWGVVASVLVRFGVALARRLALTTDTRLCVQNVTNVLFNSIICVSLTGFFYWILGFGFAYGTDADGNACSLAA